MGAQQSGDQQNNGLGGFCCNTNLCNNDSNIDNKNGMADMQQINRKNQFRKSNHNSNSSVQKMPVNTGSNHFNQPQYD